MNNKVVLSIVFVIIVVGVVAFFATSIKKQKVDVTPFTNLEVATTTSVGVPAEVATSSATTTKQTNNQIKKEQKMTATLHTTKGDITLEFFADQTPKTVENFLKLAKAGFYDGVKFHRVIKGFMIQGGDPLTKDDAQMARWGTGGPGYMFEDEITPENSNVVGTISMANAGPNTNGSQFFINTKDNNFLDTKHTVFGEVIEGMDVVRAIENVQTGQADRPIEAVVIKSITVK